MKSSPLTTGIHTVMTAILLFTLCILSALPACGWQLVPSRPTQPEVVFYSAGSQVTELEIGQDLQVALTGGSPNTLYTVQLLDEWNTVIAQTELTTFANGASKRSLLWEETGIVGCDPWAVPAPLDYLFANLLQAEALLDGRVFDVAVSLGGVAITNEPLPLVADTSEPVAYLSDAVSCERHIYFEWETFHMSFVHPEVFDVPVYVFVVPSQSGWQDGDPLGDVSSNGPDFTLVPGGVQPWIIDLGTIPGPDYYDIIVRWGNSQNLFFDSFTDQVVGGRTPAMDGRTFEPCGIHCPPPSDD